MNPDRTADVIKAVIKPSPALIEKTKAGEMFGEWDNYGRLLE